MRASLITILLSLTLPVAAAEPVESPVTEATPGKEQAADTEAITAESEAGVEAAAEQRSWVDSHKEYMDTQIERASMWVDSFFVDSEYEAEDAYSQIRLRPEFYYRKEQGAKAKFRFRARVNLPNLGRKVSFIAGADDDSGFDDSVDDSADEGVLGLQFYGKQTSKWNTSFTAGVKFNDFAFFLGPRVRYRDTVGEKGSYRFTQTVRWQTNNYWQFNTRLDLNRLISEKFYFRQTFDGRWRGEKSEDEGYRTRISSFLTHRLNALSGFQYEFSTIFHTRPDTHVDRYVVAARYRRQTKLKWLYYEIVPQVSWDEEYDYKFNPGIRLRLEFFYGKTTSSQFWKGEAEDTDEFRW